MGEVKNPAEQYRKPNPSLSCADPLELGPPPESLGYEIISNVGYASAFIVLSDDVVNIHINSASFQSASCCTVSGRESDQLL